MEEEKSDSESDDAPPEEVSRAVAEKEVEEERVQKKRAVDAKQMEKATAKRMRLEKRKNAGGGGEENERRRRAKRWKGKEEMRDEEQHEGEECEEDPDAFMLDEDVVDAVAANENELKEKYLRDFHDTKSQRKKRKKQMKRERERKRWEGKAQKFTTRDGFDVVIRSKVDELAEVKSNPKAVDFVQQRLNNKHRRDGQNAFAIREPEKLRISSR